MQLRNSLTLLGITLLLRVGFSSVLAINPAIDAQTAVMERSALLQFSPHVLLGPTRADNPVDCAASVPVQEVTAPDELGGVLEDSIEILRVGIKEAILDFHQGPIGSKVAANDVRRRRPDISPPLLV